MPQLTRREFTLRGLSGAAALSLLATPLRLLGSPLGLPLGLQLYSVREMLPKDYEGVLHRIAALGYQEVEAAGFYNHTAPEVKKAMDDAGLRCVSGHYAWTNLEPNLAKIIDFHHEIGAEYIICSFPGFKDPNRVKDTSYANRERAFTLEDWRWNAEQFNRVGKLVKTAGLRFGYHNHTMEFAQQGGFVPYDELLRLTDPTLVTFEMDCGWVVVGGGDPVAYLRRYANRISMLHVKDFKRVETKVTPTEPPPAAELGQGTADYRSIFEAAKRAGGIKHYFVEQEAFDMDPYQALKIDADYMKALQV